MSNELTLSDGVVASVETTTYCTNAQIEEEFGIATVNKAADLTGSMTDPEIEAQKDAQRLAAFDYCNSKLRGGAYETIPIAVADRPDIISKVEAIVAYVFLARKRPIGKDDDGAASLKSLMKEADSMLRDIRRGFYQNDVAISRGMTFGSTISSDSDSVCLCGGNCCNPYCYCNCPGCTCNVNRCEPYGTNHCYNVFIG